MANIRIPKYSLSEELINSISHGISALLSIAGLVFCILKAENVFSLVSVILYCSFMIILYTLSCIYHALSPKTKGKKVLRVLDHCGVLLMVAGTYMPICLSLLINNPGLGWTVFGIVWVITITAVVFNAINVDKYEVISVICNLILGWGVLAILKPISYVCRPEGIFFLIFGGILYTVGAVLYAIGAKVKFMHSIFHFFVIAGSLSHFLFIYLYCI